MSLDEELEKLIVKGRIKGSKNYDNDILINVIEFVAPKSID
jgi:predicted transcriptional regulator